MPFLDKRNIGESSRWSRGLAMPLSWHHHPLVFVSIYVEASDNDLAVTSTPNAFSYAIITSPAVVSNRRWSK